MLEGYLRPKCQALFFDPMSQWLVSKGVKANWLTLLSVMIGIGSYPLFVYDHLFWALCALWCSGILDVLDGSVARHEEQATPMGSLLDVVGDRVVEVAVVFALFSVAPQARGFLCLMMLACILICVTSFVLVGLFSSKTPEKSFYYSPGLMERAEAFLFFSAMMICPQGFTFLAWAFSLLVFYTALRRIYEFSKEDSAWAES